jgi:hypothetical protein
MSGSSFWRQSPAAPWRCPRCGAAGIRAIAEGVPCRLDAVPVSLLGELHARLAGKQSYELRGSFLICREPERIAGGARGPILVEHKCGNPIPVHHRAHVFASPVASEESSDDEYPY